MILKKWEATGGIRHGDCVLGKMGLGGAPFRRFSSGAERMAGIPRDCGPDSLGLAWWGRRHDGPPGNPFESPQPVRTPCTWQRAQRLHRSNVENEGQRGLDVVSQANLCVLLLPSLLRQPRRGCTGLSCWVCVVSPCLKSGIGTSRSKRGKSGSGGDGRTSSSVSMDPESGKPGSFPLGPVWAQKESPKDKSAGTYVTRGHFRLPEASLHINKMPFSPSLSPSSILMETQELLTVLQEIYGLSPLSKPHLFLISNDCMKHLKRTI